MKRKIKLLSGRAKRRVRNNGSSPMNSLLRHKPQMAMKQPVADPLLLRKAYGGHVRWGVRSFGTAIFSRRSDASRASHGTPLARRMNSPLRIKTPSAFAKPPAFLSGSRTSIFGQGTIIIHDGKDVKHRVVALPRTLESRLKAHLDKQRENHANDLAGGCCEAHMPEALLRQYPNASREWPWQFLFPSATLCPHPRTGRIA